VVQGFHSSYNDYLKEEAKKPHNSATITHTAKIVVKVLGRRVERKIEVILEEDHLGFRRGKETKGAIAMLKLISERTLDIDKELCACIIN
jgi:hypothetical protein